MIIKSLSVSKKSGIKRLVKYIFKEQIDVAQAQPKRYANFLPKEVQLTRADKDYLKQEMADGEITAAYEAFRERTGNSSYKDFMNDYHEKNQQPFVIKQNIRSRSMDGWIKELEEYEERRIRKTSNQIAAYHTILSWSPKDASNITDTMLKDIAKQYSRLRGKNVVIIGTKHIEKDHLHLHLAESATLLNGRSSRLSKQQFAELKVKLQEYQLEKYPVLAHSQVAHGKGSRTQEREYAKKIKFSERLSGKDALLQLLDASFSKSSSKDHFLSQLPAQGIQPYSRGDKVTGVEFNGLKFRFTRLGYEERLLELEHKQEKADKELQEIQSLRKIPFEKSERLANLMKTTNSDLGKEMAEGNNSLDELKSIRENSDRENEKEDDNDRSDDRNDDERQDSSDKDDDAKDEADEHEDDDSDDLEDNGSDDSDDSK